MLRRLLVLLALLALPSVAGAATHQAITYYPSSSMVTVGGEGAHIRYDRPTNYDWYVDFVGGLDANDGKTDQSALQTITALEAKTIKSGERIGLARGSHWREELNITVDNVVVEAYGTGATPILDASDVVPAGDWNKTAGYTNIYDVALTHEATAGGAGPVVRVWEDGLRLPRAANLAACDATAGTYFPSAETSPYTLYVHATGSSDPEISGRVYEVPVRNWGLYSWDAEGIRVSGLVTKRNMHVNGSLVIGKFGVASNVTAEEGTKHNVFFREGSRGIDVTASELYNIGANASMVILYDDSQSATDGREDFVMSRITCQTTDTVPQTASECFYSHTSGFTATWDITTHDLISTKVASANLAGSNTTGTFTHNSPTVSNTGALSAAIGCGGGTNFYLNNATATTALGNSALLFANNTNPCRITGGTFGPAGGAQTYIGYASAATTRVYIDGATFTGNASDYYMLGFNIGGNPAVLDVRNTTFSTTQAGSTFAYRLAAGYTFSGDYNTYVGVAYVAQVGAVSTSLATWQGDTGQDIHSVGP